MRDRRVNSRFWTSNPDRSDTLGKMEFMGSNTALYLATEALKEVHAAFSFVSSEEIDLHLRATMLTNARYTGRVSY